VAAIVLALCVIAPTGLALGRAGSGDQTHGTPNWAEGLLTAAYGAEPTPLAAATPVELTVTLMSSDASGLAAFDASVGDPASPQFHRFLTESQYSARFEPSSTNLTAVEGYFRGFGAAGFSPTPDRAGVTFSIGLGGAEQALGTTVGTIREGPTSVRVLESSPSLPPEISREIAGIGGLTGSVGLPAAGTRPPTLLEEGGGTAPARPAFLNGTGTISGTQWFVGSDFIGLYNETPLLPGEPDSVVNASFASSEAVATLLMSGYNQTTGLNLPPWNPVAVQEYVNDTFPAGWPSPQFVGVPVAISGITPPGPGSPGSLGDDTNDAVENSLDLEMAGSAAPGVEVANFYFPASLEYATPSAVTDGQVADDFATDLSNALSYDYGNRTLASVSASFGIADLNDSLWDEELAHAAALGVTVMAASGDSGNAPASQTDAYLGPEPGWPASAAFNTSGTLSVGGATLASGGASTGTFDGTHAPTLAYDADSGPIFAQSAWYDTLGGPGNFTGTEGGGATLYREPSWQFDSAAQPAIAGAEGIQKVASLARAEPDLGLSANSTIAFTGISSIGNVEFAILQGTSIAAPLLAGLVAEMSVVAGHRFGYLDPAIYRIAGYFWAHPGTGDPFLGVTKGSNYLFSAGLGWDALTGWGGLDPSRFLSAYANPAIVGYVYNGPTPGLPSATAPISPLGVGLILGVTVLIVGIVLLAVVTQRRSGRGRIQLAPSGFPNPSESAPIPEGVPQFECPYCGSPRPAEPVRCPTCGRL
jgi:subtilase family serine protease